MAHLLVETKDGIATLTMNRPDARNALSDDMKAGLDAALHRIERDPAIRCVVLRGAGEHFMAGGDVKGFAAKRGEMGAEGFGDHMLHLIHDLHLSISALRRLPKPTVAAVRGSAAGVGVSLALACDLVVASEDAFFTLAYCHIGLTPDGSATYSLPRAIGIKRSMQLALLGERVPAAEAAAMGMINFAVPPDRFEAEVAALAARLAAGPTQAYANAKRLLYRSIESDFEAQLQAEAEALRTTAMTEDFAEGVQAFVEKRKPRFTGR